MKQHKILIRPNADMVFIYHDALRFLVDQAKEARIERVSDVDPDTNNFWRADLSRVGGPVSPPFRLREDALAWEVAWVNANVVK